MPFALRMRKLSKKSHARAYSTRAWRVRERQNTNYIIAATKQRIQLQLRQVLGKCVSELTKYSCDIFAVFKVLCLLLTCQDNNGTEEEMG